MADGMTQYLQKKLLDHVLTLAAYTMPTSIWLSLHLADPTKTGSHANEVSGSTTGYARQNLTLAMTATSSTTGISSNSSIVTVGPATVNWGTVTNGAVEDAQTVGTGNMLITNALTTAQTINNGANFQLAPTQLQIQFQ